MTEGDSGEVRDSLSSCMTEVLAWYMKLFNGSVNAAGNHISAADFLPHITSTLPAPAPLSHTLLSLPQGLCLSGDGMVFISQLQPLMLAAFWKHCSSYFCSLFFNLLMFSVRFVCLSPGLQKTYWPTFPETFHETWCSVGQISCTNYFSLSLTIFPDGINAIYDVKDLYTS